MEAKPRWSRRRKILYAAGFVSAAIVLLAGSQLAYWYSQGGPIGPTGLEVVLSPLLFTKAETGYGSGPKWKKIGWRHFGRNACGHFYGIVFPGTEDSWPTCIDDIKRALELLPGAESILLLYASIFPACRM